MSYYKGGEDSWQIVCGYFQLTAVGWLATEVGSFGGRKPNILSDRTAELVRPPRPLFAPTGDKWGSPEVKFFKGKDTPTTVARAQRWWVVILLWALCRNRGHPRKGCAALGPMRLRIARNE